MTKDRAVIVQIVEITDSMPASEEYGDYRGLVIEVNGQWVADAPTFDLAQRIARHHSGLRPADAAAMWFEDDVVDGRGARTWSRRRGPRTPKGTAACQGGCGKQVAIRADGKLHRHLSAPFGSTCPGSGPTSALPQPKTPRGICTGCMYYAALTQDGKMRFHRDGDDECSGSRKYPVPTRNPGE